MRMQRPPTRRRSSAEVGEAARTAALSLLAEEGVGGVTMEAVAARIGTSKPVLYRRWPDAGALVRDALLSAAKYLVPPEDTGSLRGDIRSVLAGWAASFGTPQAALYPVLVGAIPHDAVLRAAFRSDIVGWRREAMREIFARAVARGEVDPGTPVDLVSEVGQAILWHRLLITGDPIDDAFIDRILDEVVLPLAMGPHAPGPHAPVSVATARGGRAGRE